MRKAGILLTLSWFVTSVASAQGVTPKAEIFLGYQYEHITYDSLGLSAYGTNGAAGQFALYPVSWVGIVGDIGWGWARNLNAGGTAAGGTYRTYLAGPRVGLEHGPLHFYGQFLIGDAQLSKGLQNTYKFYTGGPVDAAGANSDNGWAFEFGGGVDARVAHHVYVRVGELDFLGTHFNAFTGTRFRQNNFRYLGGLVLRF